MPRPRSEDRRNAILSAATRVIAAQGLGAPTAAIAKDAGVSNGLLFVYFDTKAILLNELYVTLKKEMGAVAVAGLPVESNVRERVLHLWNQGPWRDAHAGFVLPLTTAIADAAIDAIIREPAEAEARGSVAFEAMWRVLAGLSLPASARIRALLTEGLVVR